MSNERFFKKMWVTDRLTDRQTDRLTYLPTDRVIHRGAPLLKWSIFVHRRIALGPKLMLDWRIRNSACKISGNGQPETVINIPLKGCGTKQVTIDLQLEYQDKNYIDWNFHLRNISNSELDMNTLKIRPQERFKKCKQ